VNSKSINKAAILMIALGPRVAGKVMQKLPEELIEKLTAAIAEIDRVPAETKNEAVRDFIRLHQSAAGTEFGGERSAKEILEAALGQRRASTILNRATGFSDIKSFESLKNVDPLTVANYLKNEHTQTVALVLAHMDPRHSGPIMALLPSKMQGDVAYRIASLDRPSRETLALVEQVVAKAVQGEFSQAQRKFGGKKQVAEVLNEIEKETWQEILEDMSEIDDECASEVKNLMFVFEDLINLDDRYIQEILKEVDGRELSMALKGSTEDIKEKIFRNMSKRATLGIREDMEYMGPVRLQDVEEAQQRIVSVVRSLEESGTIVLGKGGAGAQMVS